MINNLQIGDTVYVYKWIDSFEKDCIEPTLLDGEIIEVLNNVYSVKFWDDLPSEYFYGFDLYETRREAESNFMNCKYNGLFIKHKKGKNIYNSPELKVQQDRMIEKSIKEFHIGQDIQKVPLDKFLSLKKYLIEIPIKFGMYIKSYKVSFLIKTSPFEYYATERIVINPKIKYVIIQENNGKESKHYVVSLDYYSNNVSYFIGMSVMEILTGQELMKNCHGMGDVLFDFKNGKNPFIDGHTIMVDFPEIHYKNFNRRQSFCWYNGKKISDNTKVYRSPFVYFEDKLTNSETGIVNLTPSLSKLHQKIFISDGVPYNHKKAWNWKTDKVELIPIKDIYSKNILDEDFRFTSYYFNSPKTIFEMDETDIPAFKNSNIKG